MIKERLPAIAVLVVAVVALGAVAATLDTGTLPGGEPGDEQRPAEDPFGDSTPVPPPSDQSESDGFSLVFPPLPFPPLWLLAGGLLLALGGALAVLFVRTGSSESFDGGGLEADETVDLDQVGRAAGEAADRIERQADASNEVYRAWREMVGLLHIDDPATTTPAEFEARAVAAGMAADDVARLTKLFEEVRYGEFRAEDREADAVAALRRIEAAHATDEDGAGGEHP